MTPMSIGIDRPVRLSGIGGAMAAGEKHEEIGKSGKGRILCFLMFGLGDYVCLGESMSFAAVPERLPDCAGKEHPGRGSRVDGIVNYAREYNLPNPGMPDKATWIWIAQRLGLRAPADCINTDL